MKRSYETAFGMLVFGAALSACGDDSPPPVLLTNVVEVSAGFDHACARRTDGSVWCWGSNLFGASGQPWGQSSDSGFVAKATQVAGLTGVKSITSGSRFNCAALNSGTVKCWGGNLYDTLGVSSRQVLESAIPFDVPTVIDAERVTSSPGELAVHACAISRTGSVTCWGLNVGQMGNSLDQKNLTLAPTVLPGVTNVVDLALGDFHFCVITNGVTVGCWGKGSSKGLSPEGHVIQSDVPLPVDGANLAVDIGASFSKTCMVSADGSVYCWDRLLFHGAPPVQPIGSVAPVEKIVGLEGVINMDASEHLFCAVTRVGQVYFWDYYLPDQPKVVPDLDDAISCNVGENFGCAVRRNGGVKCWGNNDKAQLGNGDIGFLSGVQSSTSATDVQAASPAGM